MRLLFLLAVALLGTAQAANNAAFVSQSLPAGMLPGQSYTVSVTMQNTGTTTWTPGTYRMGSQNPLFNTTWGSDGRLYLPAGASIAPGQNGTFSKTVTAPSTPGTYNFEWRTFQELVEWFGATSPAVAVKVGVNDAAFVSQSVPPVMTPGQSYAVSVTMQNSGGKTWAFGTSHRLGAQNPQDNTTWGTNRVNVPASIAPGSSGVFSFNVTAPATPGTYNFQWKMVQDGVEWFGALSANAAIKVGLDNAAFVSQSVPAIMSPGQSYPVSVTMQNTGSTTWAAGTVGLGSQPPGNANWGQTKISLASPVGPGAQVTFNFNVTAPANPGTYDFRWRMVEGTNGWFGAQSANAEVDVLAGSPEANVFFIHTDHLNTPRLVADAAGTTVWKWDQQEPFGNNPVDENPSGLGVFDLPLRLLGQYFDKETNLFYNYYRDYDPSIGRYTESDPVGLNGGLNTYAYVSSTPLSLVDPYGLDGDCYKYTIISVSSLTATVLKKTGQCPWDMFIEAAIAKQQNQAVGQTFDKKCDKGNCANQKPVNGVRTVTGTITQTFWWSGMSGTLNEADGTKRGWKKCTVTLRLEGTGHVEGWEGECICK